MLGRIARKVNRNASAGKELLQLSVLRLGFFQDADVWVGVFHKEKRAPTLSYLAHESESAYHGSASNVAISLLTP